MYSCNCNCRNNVAIKSFIMHSNIFPFLNKFFPCGGGCWSLSQLYIMLPAHLPSLVHMPAWTESRPLLRLVPHRSEPLQNFVHPLFVYVCMGDARNKEKQALLWKQWMKQQIRRRMEACLRGLLLNYSKVSCVRLFQAIVSSLPAVLSVMVYGTIFWIGLGIAHSLKLYFILFALFHFNRAFWIKIIPLTISGLVIHTQHSITTAVANVWTFSFCYDEFIHSNQETSQQCHTGKMFHSLTWWKPCNVKKASVTNVFSSQPINNVYFRNIVIDIMGTWLELLHIQGDILLASSSPLTAQGYEEIHYLFNTN